MDISIYDENNHFIGFAFNLEVIKENSRSLYLVGMYNDTFRVDKKDNKVYKNNVYVGRLKKL